MNFQIVNFVEPSRVRMIWQSPYAGERTKFHVGDLIRAGSQVALYYNRNSADWIGAVQNGFNGYPAAFPVTSVVHHDNVLEIIRRRLPPRNRSDFGAFLYKNGLSNNPMISDLALIGYSGARLPGDGFSFEIDYSIEEMPFEFLFEVSGFRYYSGMNIPVEAVLDRQVLFQPEPSNAHDPNAIMIKIGDALIGYVPRSHAPWINAWLQFARLGAWVAKIEGPPSRPLVYVYLAVARQLTHQSISHALGR
jgi:hypothetical protein